MSKNNGKELTVELDHLYKEIRKEASKDVDTPVSLKKEADAAWSRVKIITTPKSK